MLHCENLLLTQRGVCKLILFVPAAGCRFHYTVRYKFHSFAIPRSQGLLCSHLYDIFFICFQVTSLICAALNGWASIVIDGTLTALTAAWFPAGERTTATGLIVALQMAGLVPPSLLFPWLVPEPPPTPPSSQDNKNLTTTVAASSQLAADIRDEVAVILYGEAALAAALLAVMLVFFPDRPPSPPSKSAGSARLNVRSSLRDIFRKPKCVAAGASTNNMHTSGFRFCAYINDSVEMGRVPVQSYC